MKTLDTLKAYEEATEDRLWLERLGYRPLPLANKIAFMKGWPTMPVTPRIIEDWPPTVSLGGVWYPAATTGIQMTGDLVGVDVDVLDKEVVDELFALATSVFGETWQNDVLVRVGKPPKELWLFRTDTPFRMWKTPRYVDQTGVDHMIEVYGGASTRYFGALGPHSLIEDDNGKPSVVGGHHVIKHQYEWLDGLSPTEVPVSDLPVVETERLLTFLTRANDLLAGVEGWSKVEKTTSGMVDGGVSYDLTRQEVFDTPEGLLSYDEAVQYAQSDRRATCSASWLDGERHKNKGRCTLTAVDGDLQVFDFDSYVTHMPVEWKPDTPEERREKIDKLSTLMNSLNIPGIEEAREAGADTEAFEAVVKELVTEYALYRDTAKVCNLQPGRIDTIGTVAGMKLTHTQHTLTWEGPRGGTKKLSPVDVWLSMPERVVIDGVRFNPTKGRTYTEGNAMYANRFNWLPVGVDDKEARQVMLDFLEHLIPHTDERVWFIKWLAGKVQRPQDRNVAVMFLAGGISGAGRSWLMEIINIMLGGYTTKVSEADLLAGSFNAFMEDSLMVFCEEIGGAGYVDRKAAYEVLKARVDPAVKSIAVNRKFVSSYNTTCYTTFMMATNNPNALPLDAEDRRVAVISNGTPLSRKPALLQLMRFIPDERKAAALRWYLDRIVVDVDLTVAPAFEGREVMMAANESDVEEYVRMVIEEAPAWRAWTVRGFKEAVMTRMGMGRTPPGLNTVINCMVGMRSERIGAEVVPGKMKVGSSSFRVVCKDLNSFAALSPAQREKVVNGLEPDADDTNVVTLRP